MYLPHVDKQIEKLVRTFQTRDPFQLAKEIGVKVVEEDLGDIYGYYSRSRRIQFIHINDRFEEPQRRITCAHELGHCVLHPSENTPFLSKTTIVSELKIEKEANYFATNLLVNPDDDGIEYLNDYQKLEYYGLPEEFERYL